MPAEPRPPLRFIPDYDPFQTPGKEAPPYADASTWPGKWLNFDVGCVFFRLRFALKRKLKAKIHASFDERGELRLDGVLLERGPYSSDPRRWRFFSYELDLQPGEHSFSARAWALGDNAPWGQMSSGRPGFLLAAEGDARDALSTGIAPWETAPASGMSFDCRPEDPYVVATGAVNEFDLAKYGRLRWRKATRQSPAYSGRAASHYNAKLYLESAELPSQREEPIDAGSMKVVLTGDARTCGGPFEAFRFDEAICDKAPACGRLEGVSTPAGSKRFLLVDFQDYHALRYEVSAKGRGGRISVEFCEALFDDFEGSKRKRFALLSQCWLKPHGDVFRTGAKLNSAEPAFLRCGRFMLLRLEAGQEDLLLEKIEFRKTGFPLEFASGFSAVPDRFSGMEATMKRTLSLCAHEYTMDCPFYEQLMYVGDTRVQNLAIFAATGDSRLPWNAAALFDCSRDLRGLSASSYPARGRQSIPPYSLLDIALLHDNMMWSKEGAAPAGKYLGGVRSAIDFWEGHRDKASGLLRSPPGWNYIDDTGFGKWKYGVAPGGWAPEISSVSNLLFLYAAKYAAALEELCGDKALAQRCRHLAELTAQALDKFFWREDLLLFADDLGRESFSEHAQILALLSGAWPGRKNALFDTDVPMARATYYFSHYYYECCALTGRIDRFMERFSGLEAGIGEQGLLTTPEGPGNARSDCHAWSSGALFHYYATLAGIRPASPGFKSATIRPQLGALERISGRMVHPEGFISFDFANRGGRISGEAVLPAKTSGTLLANGMEIRSDSDGRCVIPD